MSPQPIFLLVCCFASPLSTFPPAPCAVLRWDLGIIGAEDIPAMKEGGKRKLVRGRDPVSFTPAGFLTAVQNCV